MAVVHRVEADQRGEQADVGFGQVFAGQVAIGTQQFFQVIEFREQTIERFFVSLLRSGEACAVHTVVHRRINPLVQRIDLAA
ncbi:hypothetical protein D3C73_1154610 [compost metagenome]